ncbi:hypothetical protein C8K30_101327 [Promicromonospora sp. AC04]|uniref:hypothetical protein n=1 Tax=Promicromonospora sp. AC04 TaxID=2135723 RepID=UPI000D3A626E|nr:hypothetical protein [Promicromonospora sp. AC04]PUB31810.1 hypothetical protein C8K30_101327 [Promicromonospora sp. AC04]
MGNYTTIPGFESVYLEDSWVLGIRAEPEHVSFEMEVVLNPSHAAYTPPVPGEQYCYRRAVIRFDRVEALSWTGQGVVLPAVDATGVQDFGSIDRFEAGPGEYVLEGDFGRVGIKSSGPTLELLS